MEPGRYDYVLVMWSSPTDDCLDSSEHLAQFLGGGLDPSVSFDSTESLCRAQGFVASGVSDSAGVFQPLSLEQGQEIGGAIALLWATAFALRWVRKALNT